MDGDCNLPGVWIHRTTRQLFYPFYGSTENTNTKIITGKTDSSFNHQSGLETAKAQLLYPLLY